MEKPKDYSYKKSVMLGCSLFGVLYIISAIGLVTVGVYGIMEEGVVFGLKTPLWIGGALFIGGAVTIGVALWGKDSLLGSLLLLVVCVASFLLCLASVLLLEFAEKKHIFRSRSQVAPPVAPNEVQTTEKTWRSPYIVFLVYLMSSVVGLVSSLVGYLYIYCILVAPVRRQQWKAYQVHFHKQGLVLGKGQSPVQDQHTRDQQLDQDARDPHDEVEMRCQEPSNQLPRMSWIYDARSMDSLEAPTPPKHGPVLQRTLKKEVVEELQHHSAFVEHQHQTRSSPSPEQEIPPPPPHPPTPPPVGMVCRRDPSPHPSPQSSARLERNEKRSTARSLEHYPIPRKYSGRGLAARSRSWRQHPQSGRQSVSLQHHWHHDVSTFGHGGVRTNEAHLGREESKDEPVSQDAPPTEYVSLQRTRGTTPGSADQFEEQPTPVNDEIDSQAGIAGGGNAVSMCPLQSSGHQRCEAITTLENRNKCLPQSVSHSKEEASAISHAQDQGDVLAETTVPLHQKQMGPHKPMRQCPGEAPPGGYNVTAMQLQHRSVNNQPFNKDQAIMLAAGNLETQDSQAGRSHPKASRHCHSAESSLRHVDHPIRPHHRSVPAQDAHESLCTQETVDDIQVLVNPLQHSPRHFANAGSDIKDTHGPFPETNQKHSFQGNQLVQNPQSCTIPDSNRDHHTKPFHYRQSSIYVPPRVHPKPSLHCQSHVGRAQQPQPSPRAMPRKDQRDAAIGSPQSALRESPQSPGQGKPVAEACQPHDKDGDCVDHLQPRCAAANPNTPSHNEGCMVASTRL